MTTQQIFPPRAFTDYDKIATAADAAGEVIALLHQRGIANKNVGFFVVIDAERSVGRPGMPLWQSALLYEGAWGIPRVDWEPGWIYDDIARAKAYLSWRERMDTLELVTMHPERLRGDDVRYPGGIYRHPFVIAFSGIQARLDHAVAGILYEVLRGIAGIQAETTFTQMAQERLAFIPESTGS